MNKKKQMFCKLMASRIYTPAIAVETVWGVDAFEDNNEQADYLLANKKIVKRIAQEHEGNMKQGGADSDWIKAKLVSMVEMADSTDYALRDPNVMRYALDMLNKMNGNYNDDLSNVANVQLSMKF